MVSINIQFPLEDDKSKGGLFRLTKTTKDALISNFILFLFTDKGERYYNVNYGSNLKKYLFDPNDSVTFDEIKKELNDDLKKYIPQLKIINLGYLNNNNSENVSRNEMRIVIDFTYTEDTFSDVGKLELTL